MTLSALQAINAEIRQLKAHKRLVGQRDNEVPKALTVLLRYAQVLTPAQRRQAARIIGEVVGGKPARAVKTGAQPRKGRKLGKVPPKYQLPSGETWAGRGLAPKAFTAWAKSAEGKTWTKSHPGTKFPAAVGAANISTPAVKKNRQSVVKKATKRKAAKKTAKRA